MSGEKITVDQEALRELLSAILGPPYLIRELLVTRNLPGSEPNCIEVLREQYNKKVWSDKKGAK